MSLLITPPRGSLSLWQSVCETHGVLARAVRSSHALWIGRLHEFQHLDGCNVWVGGLRCMFCFGIVETQRWLPAVQICCDDCVRVAVLDPGRVMTPLAVDEFPALDVIYA
jgi:hypothetical protein